MDSYWLDYVKTCYDLVTESEGYTSTVLPHDTEAYVVHMMARNILRTDIGEKAVAIQLLTARSTKNKEEFLSVADECLLIHSYPLKRQRWPSATYYQDMGVIAYGMANHEMEHYFGAAATVLKAIFGRTLNNYKLT